MVTTKPYIIEGTKINLNSRYQLQERQHDFDYIYIDLNSVLNKIEIEEIYKFQLGLNKEYVYTDSNDNDSGGKGVELRHHVTVLYGLIPNQNNIEIIKSCIPFMKPIKLIFEGISFFRPENKSYDVMKIGICSSGLSDWYNVLSSVLKIDGSSMAKIDEFHAHATLAYVTKGSFNEYENYNFSFSHVKNGGFPVHEIKFQDQFDVTTILTI